MARLTGLEPVTSGVTGRHSDQLNYNRKSLPVLHVRIAIDIKRIPIMPEEVEIHGIEMSLDSDQLD